MQQRPRPTLLLELGGGVVGGGGTEAQEAAEVLLQQALRHATQHLNEPAEQEQRDAALEELRTWVQSQPHLNARIG